MSIDLHIEGTVQVLHVDPNDKIIVTVDRAPDEDMLAKIKERLNEVFPGNEVLVVSKEVRLAVVKAT